MEVFLGILGVIFILGGIIGCFLPVLPGPPLAYVALLMLQFGATKPFSTNFLLIMGLVVAVITILDYVIPAIGAKKWGGTKYGIIGAFAGVILGIFVFPPFGFLVLPFIGAMLGEIIAGSATRNAMKSALGTFVGLIFGTVIKLSITVVIAFYFFGNL